MKKPIQTSCVILFSLLLVGCSSQVKGQCQVCGEDKPMYTVAMYDGDNLITSETSLCEDCAYLLKEQTRDVQFDVRIEPIMK